MFSFLTQKLLGFWELNLLKNLPLPLLSTDFWQEPFLLLLGLSLPNSAIKTFCRLLKVVVRLVLEAMMFQRHYHYLEIHTK